jgi:hypothetical protein
MPKTYFTNYELAVNVIVYPTLAVVVRYYEFLLKQLKVFLFSAGFFKILG